MAKMTRKEALELMLEITREGFETEEVQNARAIIENMIVQIDKQAARPKSKSTARIENERMAREFIALIRECGKPVNAKWMTEHIRYCTSTQKAVQVAKVAEEWGAVERVTIKKRTYYEYVDSYEPLVK